MAPTLVQAKTNVGATASLVIGATQAWATPTSGNLLVASTNSDGTATAPSGFTAGPSVVDGNAAYSYYKISAGTESTVTFGNGANNTVVALMEYSGLVGATPLDASNSATATGSALFTTPSVSVTTLTANDLIVVMALIHGAGAGTPASPSWSNSFVNRVTATQGAAGATNCASFIADQIVGAAAAYSTVCTWTTAAALERQALILAFKASAGAAAAIPDIFMGPMGG